MTGAFVMPTRIGRTTAAIPATAKGALFVKFSPSATRLNMVASILFINVSCQKTLIQSVKRQLSVCNYFMPSRSKYPTCRFSGKNDFGLLQDAGQNGQSRGRRLRTIGLDFGFGSSGRSSSSPSNTRCGTARTKGFSVL